MTEPVSLSLAKAHLNIEAGFTADDTLLTGYITAARELVEQLAGDVLLVQRPVTEYHDAWGDYLTLYKHPIAADADVAIAYVDEAEAEQDYTGAVLRRERVPARAWPASGSTWPTLSPNGGITVTYTAGYAADAVPQRYIQAILLLTAHFYRNRLPVSIATNLPAELQFAVTSLVNRQPVI